LAEASQPPPATDNPASSCIIGSRGVNANRPTPIATASAESPETATLKGELRATSRSFVQLTFSAMGIG
jgi:hypothetical protein